MSATRLNMGSRCGEQLRRRYVEGDKVPPGIAAHLGRGVDEAVNANMLNVRDAGHLLNVSELGEIARDTVHRGVDAEGLPPDEEPQREALVGEAVDMAVRLTALHAIELAPHLRPVEVQRWFHVELPDYDVVLSGVIDLEEQLAGAHELESPAHVALNFFNAPNLGYGGEPSQRVIRDTKTAKRAPSADAAAKSLQLTVYALEAWLRTQEDPPPLVLDYLIKTKVPKLQLVPGHRRPDDFGPLLDRIEAYVQAWHAGTFAPADPDWWGCSPRWCGYYDTCRYVQARPVTVIAGSPQQPTTTPSTDEEISYDS